MKNASQTNSSATAAHVAVHTENRRIFWLRHYLNRLVPKLKLAGVVPVWPRLCAFPNDLIGREMAVAGLYELAGLNAVKKLVSLGVIAHAGERVFIDVGANIGIYTTSLSPCFKAVLAFEPHPFSSQLLGLNVELNNISNVTLFQCALSDRDGTANLTDTGADNVGASSLETERVTTAGSKSWAVYEVELRRGDAVLDERCLAGRRVGFIKIDVEGHESSVIEGMAALIAQHKPVIAFEANSRLQSEGVRQHLEDAGYEFFYGLDFHPAVKSLPLRVLLLTLFGVKHVLRFLPESIGDKNFPLVFAMTSEHASFMSRND